MTSIYSANQRQSTSLVLILFMMTCFYLHAEEIPLLEKYFVPIKFSNIKPTQYYFNKGMLDIKVNNSASGLLYVFQNPVSINRLRFVWQREGRLQIKSAKQEASKQGDDNYLRIGLLLQGPARTIPFFAPGWVKQLRQHIKWPFNKAIYYFVDTKHPPGSRWLSPYSRDIEIISLKSTTTDSGFKSVDQRLSKAYSVVGIIIMSDGDNTKSTFNVKLKRLEIN